MMRRYKRRRTILEDGPEPIDRYVGDRVKTRRKGLRISQTKLGEALGVTFQQVQKYENGTNRIGASNLYKVSQALGVEVAYFFEGVEAAVRFYASPQAEIPEKDPMTDTESVRLAHDYFRIKDEGVRKQFGLLVKALARAEQ
jgi:transcriptional regulator with XRE-family HTH domain